MMAALQTLSALGVAGVASYTLARLAVRSRIFRYYRYALVAVDTVSLPAMPRGLCVRSIDAAELTTFPIDAPPDVQADRFAQGMTCLGAFNAAGALLGVTWISAVSIVEDDVAVRFLLPPNASWDTGLWIDPRYRLSRAFAALWAGTREWMEARGRDTSYSRIADYNLASASAHRRLGARRLGHHTVVTLGPWQISLTTRPRIVRLTEGPAELDLLGFDRSG
jgi:hypothetical protein